MSDARLERIVYATQQRALAHAAARREYEETLAAIRERLGEEPADPLPMSREHLLALVTSAFFAGCVFEANRKEPSRDG